MTLDERIEKDLTDLYNNGTINGVISEAVSLQGAIKDKLSTKGMPTHFTGDRNAKTVFVVLNPGSYAEDIIVNGKVVLGSDNPCALKTEINKLKIKTGSLFDFIDSYKDGRSNFGQLTPNKQDSFDIKQADFFKAWKDSGIIIPKKFPGDRSTYEAATEEVLMKKLQLELIPYCSGEFQNKELIRLYPYVDTLFDEIFSMARKYIIFSSAIFEKLFKNKAEMAKIGAKVTFGPKQYPDPSHPILKKDGKPTSTRFNCTRIKIDYNGKGKIAMIAPTFFKKGIAGEVLCQYGEFCYNEYNRPWP